MIMKLNNLFIILFYIMLSGCINKNTESEKLHNLFDEVWENGLQEFPVRATYLGDYRYNDRLSDMSIEAINRRNEKNKLILKQLQKY